MPFDHDTVDHKLGPTDWDDYIGQEALKARLEAHITAAIAEQRPLEHILLDGPPGSGKTTIADIIAARLGDPVVHLNRPVSQRRLAEILYELGAGILFIDEVQAWSRSQREALLGVLEEGRLTTEWSTIEVPWLTVIVATTERGQLGAAFEDRFLIQTWDPYSEHELGDIAINMAIRAGVGIDEVTLDGIAKASAGSPRQCRKLIQAARAIAHTIDEERLVTIEEILHHAQLEPDGLGRAEMSYLDVLKRHPSPVGLEVLVDTLGLHRTRVRAIERMLVDRDLVQRTKAGRVLTAAGRQRAGGHVAPPRARRPAA